MTRGMGNIEPRRLEGGRQLAFLLMCGRELPQLSSPGGESTERSHCHNVSGGSPAHIREGLGQWAVCVQLVVRHHHSQSGGHTKVGKEADEQ